MWIYHISLCILISSWGIWAVSAWLWWTMPSWVAIVFEHMFSILLGGILSRSGNSWVISYLCVYLLRNCPAKLAQVATSSTITPGLVLQASCKHHAFFIAVTMTTSKSRSQGNWPRGSPAHNSTCRKRLSSLWPSYLSAGQIDRCTRSESHGCICSLDNCPWWLIVSLSVPDLIGIGDLWGQWLQRRGSVTL